MGLLYSHKLVDCIEDLFLDAGPCIQVVLRDNLVHFLVHAFCAAVSVSHRIAEDVVVFVQQHIVNSPCVDPHGYRNLADLFTLFQSVLDLRDQAFHIPAERTVLIVHSVRKTVHFLELHLPVLHAGEHVASA